MGGQYLPVDPFYLSWRAPEFDMATEFIELAVISYKAGVRDIRESPTLKISELLAKRGT